MQTTFHRALEAAAQLGVGSDARAIAAQVTEQLTGQTVPQHLVTPDQYTHQHPDCSPVSFSSKPCRIRGVKYTPKWAWSDDYRKHFRAQHSYKRDRHAMIEAYLSWYRDTHGKSYEGQIGC